MRKQDISEKGIFKSFHQGIQKGFKSTQKGGALSSDSYERSVKDFFSGGKDSDMKPEKPEKQTKTKKPDASFNYPGTSNAPIDIKNGIPKTAKFELKGELWGYDEKKKVWTSEKGKSIPAEKGVKLYNKTNKNKRDFMTKETEDKTMDKAIKEGLADLAHKAEADHEVQMARADLYKIAKYAIKLHDMLKEVSEEQGLEGWQQAKITKASDYISSVYHNLDYDMKFGEQVEEGKYKSDAQRKAVHAAKADKKKDKYKESIARKLEQKLSGK